MRNLATKNNDREHPDEYVTKHVVLAKYKVSERTLSNWIKSKRIPVLRLSERSFRYRISDIDKALEGYRVHEVKA
jgi:predicted site-specific integrase-resolvase